VIKNITLEGSRRIWPGLLLCLLAACANFPAPRLGSTQGEAVQQQLANDFPFPQGARVDHDKTIILGGGANWTGRVLFSTSSSPTEVFDFYRDQLPAAGWQTISLIKAKTSILTFVKQDRSVTVDISDGMSGTSVGVTMSARIDSLPQPVAAPAPAKK
jgi:hypothetical protein